MRTARSRPGVASKRSMAGRATQNSATKSREVSARGRCTQTHRSVGGSVGSWRGWGDGGHGPTPPGRIVSLGGAFWIRKVYGVCVLQVTSGTEVTYAISSFRFQAEFQHFQVNHASDTQPCCFGGTRAMACIETMIERKKMLFPFQSSTRQYKWIVKHGLLNLKINTLMIPCALSDTI